MPKVSVSISRNSRDGVRIYLRDDTSRIIFVEAELTLEDYALLITGLSEVEANATYRDLSNVGKKKIIEKRSIETPFESYDRDKLERWLIDNCQEHGWFLNSYLRSQSSLGEGENGGTKLHYSVYKYVDESINNEL